METVGEFSSDVVCHGLGPLDRAALGSWLVTRAILPLSGPSPGAQPQTHGFTSVSFKGPNIPPNPKGYTFLLLKNKLFSHYSSECLLHSSALELSTPVVLASSQKAIPRHISLSAF